MSRLNVSLMSSVQTGTGSFGTLKPVPVWKPVVLELQTDFFLSERSIYYRYCARRNKFLFLFKLKGMWSYWYFPFDYDPNGIPFGSYSNVLTRFQKLRGSKTSSTGYFQYFQKFRTSSTGFQYRIRPFEKLAPLVIMGAQFRGPPSCIGTTLLRCSRGISRSLTAPHDAERRQFLRTVMNVWTW